MIDWEMDTIKRPSLGFPICSTFKVIPAEYQMRVVAVVSDLFLELTLVPTPLNLANFTWNPNAILFLVHKNQLKSVIIFLLCFI